jgi:hypothetical protein
VYLNRRSAALALRFPVHKTRIYESLKKGCGRGRKGLGITRRVEKLSSISDGERIDLGEDAVWRIV